MRLLTVNAGSSSLKLTLLDAADRVELERSRDASGATEAAAALADFVAEGHGFDAAVHRLVHGGPRLRSTVRATDAVLAELDALGDLAPLHNVVALGCLRELRRLRPELPQLACFDTAFHATLPEAAFTYPVPWDWTERLGLRRYGFHGLSHAWAARRAAELLGRPPTELRLVTCHAGAGVSLAAVERGRSVDTTMGFTPNEGPPMATRSGSVDPGAVLWLSERAGVEPAELRDALEHRSGLLGVSGVSGDLRALEPAADRGEPRAALALAVYAHRLRAAVAAMAAAMGGLDALVFTGGVGENSARVRSLVCERLGFLGLELDAALNDPSPAAPRMPRDRSLSGPGAPVATLVVHAREDLVMASEARAELAGGGASGNP